MAERLHPTSPEKLNTPDDLGEIIRERQESLKASPESSHESSREHAVEHARKQVEQEAVFGKERGLEQHSKGEPGDPTATLITKSRKKTEYEATMKSVRSQLSRPSRAFSKFVHSPGVEKASEVTGATIARPNAILAGSFTAFLAVLGTYVIAHFIGFRLSGFETIAAFALGWLAGVLFDLIRVAFHRRRH